MTLLELIAFGPVQKRLFGFPVSHNHVSIAFLGPEHLGLDESRHLIDRPGAGFEQLLEMSPIFLGNRDSIHHNIHKLPPVAAVYLNIAWQAVSGKKT